VTFFVTADGRIAGRHDDASPIRPHGPLITTISGIAKP
jgi:hypothetical protein